MFVAGLDIKFLIAAVRSLVNYIRNHLMSVISMVNIAAFGLLSEVAAEKLHHDT